MSVTRRQVVGPELADMGDLRIELGEYLYVRHAHNVDVERRIPRAKQRLGDPLSAQRGSRDPGPQRRADERDLMPALIYVCDHDPTSARCNRRAPLVRKDLRQELGRQSADRRECVATRTYGMRAPYRSVYFLIGRRKGRGYFARPG